MPAQRKASVHTEYHNDCISVHLQFFVASLGKSRLQGCTWDTILPRQRFVLCRLVLLKAWDFLKFLLSTISILLATNSPSNMKVIYAIFQNPSDDVVCAQIWGV